jgi:hypothetical protein
VVARAIRRAIHDQLTKLESQAQRMADAAGARSNDNAMRNETAIERESAWVRTFQRLRKEFVSECK